MYLIEGEPDVSAPLAPLFEAFRSAPGSAVTSELTIAEVLAPTSFRGELSADLRKAYLELPVSGRFMTLMPVSRDILFDTANVRSAARMKLPDAIHLTTAIHAGCRFIVTRDNRLKAPEGLIKIAPDRDGVARILDALR